MTPKPPSSAATSLSDIANLSFESALTELETLVRQLEDGKAKLDDALTSYERGMKLKSHCESKLREAQLRVEQITLSADGKPSLSPFTT